MADNSKGEHEDEVMEDASEEDSEDDERVPAKKLANNQAEARSCACPMVVLCPSLMALWKCVMQSCT